MENRRSDACLIMNQYSEMEIFGLKDSENIFNKDLRGRIRQNIGNLKNKILTLFSNQKPTLILYSNPLFLENFEREIKSKYCDETKETGKCSVKPNIVLPKIDIRNFEIKCNNITRNKNTYFYDFNIVELKLLYPISALNKEDFSNNFLF